MKHIHRSAILCLTAVMLCLISTCVYAQSNLVLNGAFEVYDSCPYAYDQIRYTHYWDAIDTNYGVWGDSAFRAICTGRYMDTFPEYSRICGRGGPVQAMGFQYPHSGTGMATVAFFMDRYYYSSTLLAFEGQNYLQGRLATTLVAGRQYCVSFYVSRTSWGQYAIDKIGAYLDDGTIDTTTHPAIAQTHCTPQVVDTLIRYDTLGWEKIQGSFTANGTEKFITIGMFFDSSHFRHISSRTGARGDTLRCLYAYYFVDDVSVLPADARAYAGRDTIIMRPGDTARLGVASGGDGVPAYWY
ncbi:MAG: hypothetical protein EBX41_05600 [Chitinophagia bacterium]|nr:hypothetical protein [Chitinophagia bacterium]